MAEIIKWTQHARLRRQQRRIDPFAFSILDEYGRHDAQKGGDELIYLDKKGRRRLESEFGSKTARLLTPCLNTAVVLAPDGRVKTTFYRNRRIKRS